MAEFEVHLDVTFSGNVTVNAETEEQAMEMAKKVIEVPSDLNRHFFYMLDQQVVEIQKVEEV